MRVIQFLDYFNEFTGNPSQIYANEIKKRGYDVEVLTSDKVPTPSGYDDSKSMLKIRRFFGVRFFSKCFFPGVIPYFFLNVKENDVVHSHVLGFFSTFTAGYMKFFKKFRFVITADYDPHGKKQGFFPRLFNYFFFVIPAKNADAIICFTQNEKKTLIEKFSLSEKKITVIPIGIHYNEFATSQPDLGRKKIGLKNKFVIVSICYLSRKKNLEMGFFALEKMPQNDIVFLHAGGWSDMAYKKKLDALVKKLGLEKRVYFLGEKKLSKIRDYYLAGNVFVNLGFNESYAIPVLEAMACGLPVISTKTGIAAEIVKEGENGFFVENADELREKIVFLRQNHSTVEKMGKNNKKIAQKFDWEKIIPSLEKLYLSL